MKKYKVLKGFISEKLDKDKTMIYDQDRSLLFTFNKTATFIFEKIKKGFDDRKIIEELLKKYNVEEKIARKDVVAIIKKLKVKKIIA